jgi:hypothetical protein
MKRIVFFGAVMLLFFNSYSQSFVRQNLIISIDVIHNKVISISYCIDSTGTAFNILNDSLVGKVILDFDSNFRIKKSKLYKQNVLSDSGGPAVSNSYKLYTCYGNSECSYNKYGQLIERKEIFYRKKLLFFRKKVVSTWLRHYYIRGWWD